MSYQTPITIKETLQSIQRQNYVLPAIQREFTWRDFQICKLFDSLMQGYPIGSFLFWKVEAARNMSRLFAMVNKDGVIPFYEEKEQNLDKVLHIFIRVNHSGTPLSYSDLLLSIATAQWKEMDARQTVHGLVNQLNTTRQGFKISKDLVLKAGLMLSDIPSIAFRVTNFNAKNMKTLEDNWDSIERALKIAVELLADFGFSWQNLSADSVVIPIAYYLFKRRLDESYLEGSDNKSKQDKLPATWLQERYPDDTQRANFSDLHDLGDVPEKLVGFEKFYSARRERVSIKLRAILSIDATNNVNENREEEHLP